MFERPFRAKSYLLVGAAAAVGLAAASVVGAAEGPAPAAPAVQAASTSASASAPGDRRQLLNQYCVSCHSDRLKTAGLSLEKVDLDHVEADLEAWEKVLRRVSLGEMPPKGMRRPAQGEIASFTGWLEASLDGVAARKLDPGRSTLRRMNRAEYANAVRDLLDVELEFARELPADDSGYGFDNIADVLTVSPTLLDRYMTVASKIGRAATGLGSRQPYLTEFTPPKDMNVEYHGFPSYNERASDDLPLDSRGGASFKYFAPFDATYRLQVVLNPNTPGDQEVLKENTYELSLPLKAGMRVLGVSFRKPLALDETPLKVYGGINGSGMNGILVPEGPPKPIKMDVQVDGERIKTFEVPSYAASMQFFQATFPRDVLQLAINGPFDVTGIGDTPSRRKIFICQPSKQLSESACARKIVANLTAQAYRRPVTDADVAPLMKIYASARKEADFEHSIETTLEAILVAPQFIFMREELPNGAPGQAVPISDVELASRLSFFLWSSGPDQALLKAAQQRRLRDPAVLRQQIARMLADPRASALTRNFAGQWLYVRNVDAARPDIKEFPDFDLRLRAAMRTETEMFFDAVVRQGGSVLDFIKSDYTFLNQRLAEHYGIPNVYGQAFRKVKLEPSYNRGGLLGQGAILTVTSYDNHTSVVKRGKWVLDNILAAPPPPPPPDVPAIVAVSGGKKLTAREQIELHRANPVCASCHNKMDPLGIALENYDAVGAWRVKDAGADIDPATVLPDGTPFSGPTGLQDILMVRKDQFVEAFTERLMTYALGRGLTPEDMPAVRAIRRKAVAEGYRAGAIVEGIVESPQFQMRKVTPPAAPLSSTRIASR